MGSDHLNPGNLRDAPWFPRAINTNSGPRYYPGTSPAVLLQYHKGFWVPRSRAEGVAGAAHLVTLKIAEGFSLSQLIGIWAPPSDGNNTAVYIAHVMEWAKIPNASDPLWNFLLSV